MKTAKILWERISSFVYPVAFGALMLILWETGILHQILGADTFTLPMPGRIATIIEENFPAIMTNVWATLIVALGGLTLGSLLGYLLGMAAAIFTKWGKGGLTLASAFNAIPIIAIAPILNNLTKDVSPDANIRSMVAKILVVTIFTTDAFAKANPNTVKAFVAASVKGWAYACANPEEAAQIVYKYGSSVSSDHQLYMAGEVKKLVETDTKGSPVTAYGKIDDAAMQQTLDLAKTYIKLTDSVAADKLQTLTLDDIRDSSYFDAATAEGAVLDAPEKTDVSIQLKWLPQAQFMGYYVALDKGYYTDAGLNVTIVPGGGDISETTAVYTGQVDFGVTWVSNLIAANAGGMGLMEVAQIFQRSGLVLVYKISD
ncbi:MAG TPA: ABC transporter substrate-binding protein [Candidatus Limiplasma sp.]|nr:ABC transporter substrate-binding protein [Candidatus Limiplasma sp.]